MGSLIRSEEGSAAFEVVAQIGFDLSAADAAPAADVLIDFSNVVTLPAVASYVRRTGAALVSGTTGYTDEQMAELRSLAKTSAVLHSGNYSLGIAALRHATTLAARELAGFDVELVAPPRPSFCLTPWLPPRPRRVAASTTRSMAARAWLASVTPARWACTRCAAARSPACTR